MGFCSLQRPFFKKIVRRMAYRLADKQIRNLNPNLIDSESIANEASNSYWFKKSVGLDFQIGYQQRWAELAREDVNSGICRAYIFKNHGYNLGWRAGMSGKCLGGWSNPSLEREKDLMEEHYWKKISSGKKDDYYSLRQK